MIGSGLGGSIRRGIALGLGRHTSNVGQDKQEEKQNRSMGSAKPITTESHGVSPSAVRSTDFSTAGLFRTECPRLVNPRRSSARELSLCALDQMNLVQEILQVLAAGRRTAH